MDDGFSSVAATGRGVRTFSPGFHSLLTPGAEGSVEQPPLPNDSVTPSLTPIDALPRSPGARRVALYSHDAQGLGHMRRNLAIAGVICRESAEAVLMIAGAKEAGVFAMPPGADCLALPGLAKSNSGEYHSRSLGLSSGDVIRLRTDMIRTALESFRPDVLLVDKLPLGVDGELSASLEMLAERSPQTRLVLGMREVLDDLETARREWHAGAEAIVRERYDAVWIYGDPRVYDPVAEYGFSSGVAAKVHYTGYIDRRHADEPEPARVGADLLTELDLPPGRLALCLVGGGEDGGLLADTFSRAKLPPDTNGVVVAGPFMSVRERRRLHQRAASSARLRVLDFVPEPDALLDRADSVVAMGGYNTVCELLARDKRTLIVPRVRPRQEQLIRAERMRELGLLDMLHPCDLTSAALGRWLAARPTPRRRQRLDLNGLARLPTLVNDLLAPRLRLREAAGVA